MVEVVGTVSVVMTRIFDYSTLLNNFYVFNESLPIIITCNTMTAS